MLANSDDGGPLEVFLIMRRAPIVWSTILVLENIQSYEDLYAKVNDHHEALIESVRAEAGETITVHNLASTLRRMGFNQSSGSQPSTRRVHLTSTEIEEGRSSPVLEEGPTPFVNVEGEDENSEGTETVRQVYNTFKKRQRPPPKGGYKFTRNDHVTTKMGRAPPSPCKVCGSPNHWDKECPDWEVYMEKLRRGTLLTTLSRADEELDMLYHSAYCVLLEDRVKESSL
jgi:hypothetical protein